MAIYSLQHKTIGRSTHAPGTAGAHIRYICRASTARKYITNGFDDGLTSGQLASQLTKAEETERKNARMLDKIMVALPREFNAPQREDVVLKFIEAITDNAVPWIVAFHDMGKDEQNPHAHIAIRDRDLETGKTRCGLTEKGSTQKIRVLWQDILNECLIEAGSQSRVDHRSLKEQGIDRQPTIHEGPKLRAMLARGVSPLSKDRTSKRGYPVFYTRIDKGLNRAEHNEKIRKQNGNWTQ